MKDIAYYNGTFAPMDEMTIPINDRGVYFGDGVYEVVYVRNGRIFAWKEHMERLENSLRGVEIMPPMPFEDIKSVVLEAVAMVDAREQSVYFQITRGTFPRRHCFPPDDIKSNLLLFSREANMCNISKPGRLCTLPDERWANCEIKTINLLPNIMAAQRAREQGCDEAVLYRDGVVTECSSSNLFIIENGVLRTAPRAKGMLPGITRRHMLMLAEKLHIPAREEYFTLEEMFAADEIIVVGTSKHGMAVNEVDGRQVGGRAPELVKQLQQAYAELVESETGRL